MFGQNRSQLYLDRVLRNHDQFPSLNNIAATEPVFQILPELAIVGNEHGSVFGELGQSSSESSSNVDSPNSNGTTHGAQSPTFISCQALININSDAYCIEQGNSHESYQLASESIFESMNRATPYNAEERKERIERYRSKRNLRNFNKKIKYECRKTLADRRPRVRGRFARNDEFEKMSEEDEDYSWFNILEALNKSDA